MRYVLSAGLLACALYGQLATDYSGNDLLFASNWKLRDGPENAGPTTIYRLRGGQWTTIARAVGNVGQPSLSDDGALVAWERYFPCVGSCMIVLPRSASEAEGLRHELKINKLMVFYSPNGRFAVTPGFLSMSAWSAQDLETGSTWTFAALSRVSSVSDNGTVIGVHDGQAAVWRPGSDIVDLMPVGELLSMQVSANSAAAIVETGTYQSSRSLWRVDLASRERRLIAEWERQAPLASPATRTMSNDGTRVLFYTTQELRLYDRGDVRVLAAIPEGLWHFTLSGDGRVAWVLTRNGRLIKVHTDTSETQDLVGGLPLQVRQIYGGAVPGSVLLLQSPGSFDGVQFLIEGQIFPIVDTATTGFAYLQIPWEFPAPAQSGPHPLVIRRDGSPFEVSSAVFINSSPSAFFALREPFGSELKAALPNWDGLVTQETPAIPGSTVHAYMLGLGPLDRAVPTGAPAPGDPPARPLAAIACYLRGANDDPMPRGLELPFVAYAPGLVGVYQVDMTIPPDWPAGRHLINCEGAGYTASWIYVGARPR